MLDIKPIFEVTIGKPLELEVIIRKLPYLSENSVINFLKGSARKHKRNFGIEIFKIQYDINLDSIKIIPNSIVGLIDCEEFSIKFKPKFDGISIGKCLALAQMSNAIDLIKHDDNIVDNEISDEYSTDSIDYFSKAFLSSVSDIIKNGLLSKRIKESICDINASGAINFHKTIKNQSLYPIVDKNKFSLNIKVNQYIKSALLIIIEKIKRTEYQSISGNLLNYFSEVENKKINISETSISEYSTLKRIDYDKCLILAEIIHNGFSYLDGKSSSFTPYFSVNLDVLFERLVDSQLEKLISKDNFRVLSQQEYKHPSSPELKNKKIKPDLILKPKSSALKTLIIDCKNKYSQSENDKCLVSNSDIFQISYYSQAISSNYAILIYPGNNKNSTKYPIMGSEGKANYIKKRNKAFEKIKNNQSNYIEINLDNGKIKLFFWRVDLSGTIKDTEHSFAQLALFLTDLSKGYINNEQ